LLPNEKVSRHTRRKGNNVTTVAPSITVIDALHIMAEQKLVQLWFAENNKFLGIMTERDYSRKVILKAEIQMIKSGRHNDNRFFHL